MSDQPKTIAEQAYCDLLTMPRSQTDRDFRRAVVMAVLIGRQIEADFGAVTPWQSNPPAQPGQWEMRSRETDFEPSRVTVFDRGGQLWVTDPAIGTNLLEDFHYNLCEIMWRKGRQP